MKELASKIYQFPQQSFFGETVRSYAIEQKEVVYCFDVPLDTTENRKFLQGFQKPVRIIMSHGPTANGFETTRESLKDMGIDVEVWLHEEDQNNVWLTISPNLLLTGGDRKISEDLTLLFSPGHTKGSICLYANLSEGIIFTGDTLGGTEKGDIRPFETKSNELSSAVFFGSLRKLLDYNCNLMLPFHYFPITDANKKLREFIDKCDKKTTNK